MTKRIIELIDEIKVNKQYGQIAIYKPLLLLIIFYKVLQGHKNEFRFTDIRVQLQTLMERYGWNTFSRKKAEYPFYFLASSALWTINISPGQLNYPDSPTQSEMANAIGKLDSIVYGYLIKNPAELETIISYVKEKWALQHVLPV